MYLEIYSTLYGQIPHFVYPCPCSFKQIAKWVNSGDCGIPFKKCVFLDEDRSVVCIWKSVDVGFKELPVISYINVIRLLINDNKYKR